MRRRVSTFGIVLGVLAMTPAMSGAASTLFDTSAASVTCTTVIGSAKISPPLTTTSTGSATIKVKAVLGGCTATGATPAGLTIVSGSVAGTLTTTGAGGCAGLISTSTVAGNLVAKWKVASGQKLDFASTTVSNGSIIGSLFAPGGPLTGSYGEFTVSGMTLQPSSAFAGATPGMVAITGEDAGNLGAGCLGAPPGKGVSKITLSLGQITL